jgi:hypothetical protein
MKFTRDTYTIPIWALCALVNGDTSGLEDNERQAIEQLEGQLGPGHWALPDDIDAAKYFTHYGSDLLSHLGQDVVDIQYLTIDEE